MVTAPGAGGGGQRAEAVGICLRVEAGNAAQRPAVHRAASSTANNCLAQTANTAEAEKLWFRGVSVWYVISIIFDKSVPLSLGCGI